MGKKAETEMGNRTGKRKAGSRKKKMRPSEKRAMFILSLITVLVSTALCKEGSMIYQEMKGNQQTIVRLDEAFEEELDREAELKELEMYMQSDEYIEKIAREKLGLLKENEILFREN